MKGPLSPTTPPIADRYSIQAYLGAGGMQHVYLANDMIFERQVALKVPKDNSGNARFAKSAVVSAQVNHANIAKTLDYIDFDGACYLVEEFVQGADLSKLFPKPIPYLPPSLVARILHQLARGLAASHTAGVVHRDLKPSNIMIFGGESFVNAKITDFGIAKMAEDEIGTWAKDGGQTSTSSKTILGAIPYMAPESITDFGKSGFEADVWAIGAIAHELLTGKKPFGTGLKSIPAILEAKTPTRTSMIAGAQFSQDGADISTIIEGCLGKEPDQRPTAEELVEQIGAVCYPATAYETATINHKQTQSIGFAQSEGKKSVMCHKDNFYGHRQFSVGKKVFFARTPGSPNDRAFPIVLVDED
uniref:serine/threonine-protein kinase n=1 Tax=uncultured Erythrobacter sp. TaxID=263913 RepID=UPI00260E875D|nr:serine/threonine-protein kinase [uncultured Erythrobacter sp.]